MENKKYKNHTDNIPELDLHGISHDEARILVEEFSIMSNAPFRIIYGRSNEMARIVFETLESNGIKWISFGGNTGHVFVPNKNDIKERSQILQNDLKDRNKLVERNKIYQSKKYRKNNVTKKGYTR